MGVLRAALNYKFKGVFYKKKYSGKHEFLQALRIINYYNPAIIYNACETALVNKGYKPRKEQARIQNDP